MAKTSAKLTIFGHEVYIANVIIDDDKKTMKQAQAICFGKDRKDIVSLIEKNPKSVSIQYFRDGKPVLLPSQREAHAAEEDRKLRKKIADAVPEDGYWQDKF